MKNPVFTTILLFSLSCTASLLHAQTVKKWVDEEGVTHYSDQEPVDGGAEIKEMDVPEGSVTEYESEEVDQRIQKQLRQLEQDREAREQAAAEKERARAIEETIEREPLVVEEKKKKKKEGRSRPSGPFPRPPPGPFPEPPPGPFPEPPPGTINQN